MKKNQQTAPPGTARPLNTVIRRCGTDRQPDRDGRPRLEKKTWTRLSAGTRLPQTAATCWRWAVWHGCTAPVPGVPQDAAFAFQYFSRPLRGRQRSVHDEPAILYARGEGTPHNAHEALYWAEQARSTAPAGRAAHQCHQEERIRSKTAFLRRFFFCRSDQAAQLIFLYHVRDKEGFSCKTGCG